MPRKPSVPSYRRKIIGGRARACVTLTDRQTGQRRDVLLGDYGSPDSRAAYVQAVAAWEEAGRCLAPRPAHRHDRPAAGLTVGELTIAYVKHRQAESDPGDVRSLRVVLKVLNQLHARTPAAAFGPNALREVRDAMIRGNPAADPPRKPWSRRYCVRCTRMIVAMFRWASGREMIPPTVPMALGDLEQLRRGRSAARDTPPIECAPQAAIDAVLQVAHRHLRAMIELQLATGMRPGEVCAMRVCDLDRTAKVWRYTPSKHKGAHLGKPRVVYLGPRAQAIVKPFLKGRQRQIAAHVFSPAAADAEYRAKRHAARKTPLKWGNRPGKNIVAHRRRPPHEAYTAISYRRAVARACDRANEQAIAAARKAGHKVPPGVRLVARWHPHQLRHNAATEIRKRFGLEAARLMLGHSSALITDAVYAERDEAALLKIAAAIA